jgi:FMN-dependent oxidoreductase (nitrilotriacetate monooxygenase family)
MNGLSNGRDTRREIALGSAFQGAGSNRWSWRHRGTQLNASIDFGYYRRAAVLAEEACLDFIFVADSPYASAKSSPHEANRLEPISLLSALATVTSKLGLVATVSTSFSEPFNVARQFASLDQISQGRAGWNLVTTGLEAAALNFGGVAHLPHEVRYRIAREHLSVVQGLWDSWEDDAFTSDRDSATFFNAGKLHELNHVGEFFSVKGPLNVSRSPQGYPVLFQAGGSDGGRELAAQTADVIFTVQETVESAYAFRADLRQRAAQRDRTRAPRVMAGIVPWVGRTAEDAERRFREHADLVGIEDAIDQLARAFGHHDFSRYSLDAPFPDLGTIGSNGFRSWTESIMRSAMEGQLTLRETAMHFAVRRGPFFGSGETVADTVHEWFETGAVDGFILLPADLDAFTSFTELVLPILQRRGLFRTAYRETTLRGHLGLPVPQNVHAAVS